MSLRDKGTERLPGRRVPRFEAEDLSHGEETAGTWDPGIEHAAPTDPPPTDLLAYLTGYMGDPVFAKRFADCIDLIKAKNSDYTQGAAKRDRIAHFREAARDLQLPMLKIWQVFVRKHWSTIQKVANGGFLESEPIDGRINDIINYMVLFGAIIDDTREPREG